MRVTGTLRRTGEYQGAGPGRLYEEVKKIGDEENPVAPIAVMTAPSNRMLRLSSFYTADVEAIDIPTTPVEPEPKPDDNPPFIIVPVKTEYVVTVHDGDLEYEMKVAKKNNGVTLTPMGCEGQLFAGWYVGDKPADLTKITSDIEVYAKYVSDSYLCTKYIEHGLFRVYGMTLISALDSANYNDAGFIVNGEEISCKYSESYGTFTARVLFGSGIARNAKLMTHTLSLRSTVNGERFEVTPYWVTLDGTVVYGTTRVFVYNSRGIAG